MFTVAFLNELRRAEIDRIATFLQHGARILEIGAGTGEQALELKRRGFDVVPIELPDSNYAKNRLLPMLDYDGRQIPLPDASIDVVFSSNVLEHVPDLLQMHAEIRRVLKPGGYCVHVLPTHTWRIWTTLTFYPDRIVRLLTALTRTENPSDMTVPLHTAPSAPGFLGKVANRLAIRRHGERGNVISEIGYFHPDWWRKNFAENGFTVIQDEPVGIFYTGNLLFGSHLSVSARTSMARMLGSGSHLFKLAPR